MLIAENKQKENISEYIIHMYKTEDLLRAFEFDINQVERYIITHLPLTDKEKASEKDWYEEIINKMTKGHGMVAGHLNEVQEIVSDLALLHEKLKETDPEYQLVIDDARNDLDQYLKLADDKEMSEIQLCLNAVYGYLLLKLENRPIFDSQKDTVEKFGAILAYISRVYREEQNI